MPALLAQGCCHRGAKRHSRAGFFHRAQFFRRLPCERLPANLLQAQRDYFGAHTYERIDKPRGEFFHTNWTGHGGAHVLRQLHCLNDAVVPGFDRGPGTPQAR